MSKRSSVELYHYIDEEGLDSLYAQCGQFLVEGLTKIEKSGEIDADAEVEIGKLLSMVGLASAKIEGTLSLNRLRSESLRTIFRVEQRIPLILDYLMREGDLRDFTQAGDVTLDLEPEHAYDLEDGFVLIESEFQAPDFRKVLEVSSPDDDEVMFSLLSREHVLKPTGFVKFRSRTAVGTITMGTSLAKYVTGLRHLMMMWGARYPARVRLRVFGHLTKSSAGAYYLKPFMLAHAT